LVASNICRLIHEKRAPLSRSDMPQDSDIRPPVCACALQVFISGFARMPPGWAAIPAPRRRPSKLVDSYFLQCQQWMSRISLELGTTRVLQALTFVSSMSISQSNRSNDFCTSPYRLWTSVLAASRRFAAGWTASINLTRPFEGYRDAAYALPAGSSTSREIHFDKWLR